MLGVTSAAPKLEPGVHWETHGQEVRPVLVNKEGERKKVAWAPQPGSQALFLQCPVQEVLYEGTRGPGKTDALLMDFAQHCERGFGDDWKGILFRQTYPQLSDVIDKSKKWFPVIFGNRVRYNEGKTTWEWKTGEKLKFRHGLDERHYWNYHGHQYPWIAFEELTTWPDSGLYLAMHSTCRSTNPRVPRKIRATTNPYGPGHNWVMLRWKLPVVEGQVLGELIQTKGLPDRIAIRGRLDENRILLTADPNYKDMIRASAKNPHMAKAWLEGSWDIVAGGMFDDVWRPETHSVPAFNVPHSWRLDRSFDWGSSKPFSVGWWAESDGSDVMIGGRVRSTVRGDLFRIREWYGVEHEHDGVVKPNEGLKMSPAKIARGIVEREIAWGLHGRVRPGPADNSINDEEGGEESISKKMRKRVRVGERSYPGISWTRSDKRPGSRKQGWTAMRDRLEDALPTGLPREKPGLFIVGEYCGEWIRTVPKLQRDHKKDPDDVDTNAEDHTADETRYRIRQVGKATRMGRVRGVAS